MKEKSIKIFVAREVEPDWVSRKIMKVIGADYSHIGIIVDDTIVFHMVGEGFSQCPLKEMESDHVLQTKDITDRIHMTYALGYLQGRLGVEYSQSQYLGFLFPFMRRFVRNNKEKGVCSEEVARFLLVCGQEKYISGYLNRFIDLDFVSPKDVWETLTISLAK